jgi:ubiquinone/menaquinone biosynthesis C-methylase UbiE
VTDDVAGITDVPRGAKLDLGCGQRKRSSDYIGVDVIEAPGVDLVGDVYEHLDRLPDAWVTEVFSSHFLEHLEAPQRLLEAVARVLEPGGRFEIIVPHFSNPYFYSDWTHRRSFGLYSLSYVVGGDRFKRTVPTYGVSLPFEIETIRLSFKSPRPFYGRYAIKRAIGLVVNSSPAMQEFYEENLCWLVPCYEIQYVLRRVAVG